MSSTERAFVAHIVEQISLLETPIFTPLRLQLLTPRRYPDLVRCLFAILMLLPQSEAYRTLQARLQPIPALTLLQNEEQSSKSSDPGRGRIDFDQLLQAFKEQHLTHTTSPPDGHRYPEESQMLKEQQSQHNHQAQRTPVKRWASSRRESGDVEHCAK
jgi:hypothetical protein